MNPRRLFAFFFAVFAAGCSTPAPAPSRPVPMADLPNIDPNAIRADIRKLSSDEFEGRRPGTEGERLTVQYLIDQFKAAGLEPGNPDGTWVQKVPLVGLKPDVQRTVRGEEGNGDGQFQNSR